MESDSSVLLQRVTDEYAMLLQVETLAQQVADLQDQADAREDAHNERIEALQATIRRLSVENESHPDAEEHVAKLEAKCAYLEEQVGSPSRRITVLRYLIKGRHASSIVVGKLETVPVTTALGGKMYSKRRRLRVNVVRKQGHCTD
jgi:ABC-type phosphate transport system auxiliary subunit